MITWLFIDTSYLCHRAYHTTGKLEWEDAEVGVLYGVLRDLVTLQDRFDTDRMVFCFDSPRSLRQEMNPGYKQSRRDRYAEASEEDKKGIEEFRDQIKLLRTKVLPKTGYKNILYQEGYEADDLIARCCQLVHEEDEGIIVSSDHDLHQCLDHNIHFYSPSSRKIITQDSFIQKWELPPKHWPRVKAIAGCSSDDVVGVPGVGEITAAKFVRKVLPPGKKLDAIKANKALCFANMKLVKLPLEGVPAPVFKEDKVSKKKWAEVCRRYGFRSLASAGPMGARASKPAGVRQGLL